MNTKLYSMILLSAVVITTTLHARPTTTVSKTGPVRAGGTQTVSTSGGRFGASRVATTSAVNGHKATVTTEKGSTVTTTKGERTFTNAADTKSKTVDTHPVAAHDRREDRRDDRQDQRADRKEDAQPPRPAFAGKFAGNRPDVRPEENRNINPRALARLPRPSSSGSDVSSLVAVASADAAIQNSQNAAEENSQNQATTQTAQDNLFNALANQVTGATQVSSNVTPGSGVLPTLGAVGSGTVPATVATTVSSVSPLLPAASTTSTTSSIK